MWVSWIAKTREESTEDDREEIEMGKNMMLPTKCSTKCVTQILIQIFVIYLHNLLHICFSRFVVLFWKLFGKGNMAHFGI